MEEPLELEEVKSKGILHERLLMAEDSENVPVGIEGGKDIEQVRENLESRDLICITIAEKIQADPEIGFAKNSVLPTSSIYAVPEHLRKLNESAYIPRHVSIGPVHRTSQLPIGDEHKERYMRRLFQRSQTPEADVKETVSTCVDGILKDVARARACYKETSNDNFKFTEMMFVDGCFILELVRKSHVRDYEHDDPVFRYASVLHEIKRDLVLLENQIPFFVLQTLFQHTLAQCSSGLSLSDYIIRFFGNMINFDCKIKKRKKNLDTVDHILGLFHKCYSPDDCDYKDPDAGWTVVRQDVYHYINCSATELHRAGVIIQASEGEALDITLRKHVCRSISIFLSFFFDCLCGTCIPLNRFFTRGLYRAGLIGIRIRIWRLCIDDCNESFLRNLIAYEQCNPHILSYIALYAMLMRTIIRSKEDVEWLVKAKVLQNKLGASTEHTLHLFDNIFKDLVLTSNCPSFFEELDSLQDYVKACPRGNLPTKLKRNCASLINYYFGSRWALISMFGALILFTLQVIQTIFTVHPQSKFIIVQVHGH